MKMSKVGNLPKICLSLVWPLLLTSVSRDLFGKYYREPKEVSGHFCHIKGLYSCGDVDPRGWTRRTLSQTNSSGGEHVPGTQGALKVHSSALQK